MTKTGAQPRRTVEDFMRLGEGVRADLIEGDLQIISPSPKYRHQRIVSNVVLALSKFVEKRRLGTVVVSPMDVHLPSGDIVEPDVIFVAQSNRAILQDWIRGVPDLLVEVISPESIRRDRVKKRALYERNGVKEYWIVDDANRTVEVLKLSGKKYEHHGCFTDKERVTSARLTGLSIPVRKLFV